MQRHMVDVPVGLVVVDGRLIFPHRHYAIVGVHRVKQPFLPGGDMRGQGLSHRLADDRLPLRSRDRQIGRIDQFEDVVAPLHHRHSDGGVADQFLEELALRLDLTQQLLIAFGLVVMLRAHKLLALVSHVCLKSCNLGAQPCDLCAELFVFALQFVACRVCHGVSQMGTIVRGTRATGAWFKLWGANKEHQSHGWPK